MHRIDEQARLKQLKCDSLHRYAQMSAQGLCCLMNLIAMHLFDELDEQNAMQLQVNPTAMDHAKLGRIDRRLPFGPIQIIF